VKGAVSAVVIGSRRHGCRRKEKRVMGEADRLQASAERDQLWASLRALLPEIHRLAAGEFGGTDRERRLVQVMARIVQAEITFRAGEAQERP
jgi:hypothetical protein